MQTFVRVFEKERDNMNQQLIDIMYIAQDNSITKRRIKIIKLV